MDGIGNVDTHVQYIKSFLELEHFQVTSLIDFGFGLGHMFRACMKEFIPHFAVGIEPSQIAFEKGSESEWKPVPSTQLSLQPIDLVSWAKDQKKKSPVFDLGLCTSVFQYLSEDEIEFVLPIMAQKSKLIYFSVPTRYELEQQVEQLEFHDRFAKRRKREWYWKKLKPHFCCIGSRFLESKVHYNHQTSQFTDDLFRF